MDNSQNRTHVHPRQHELEIACAILRTSIRQLSIEWGCSDTHIRHICRGYATSERIEALIEETIQEAKELVPFSYPTNEQTNEQAVSQENAN